MFLGRELDPGAVTAAARALVVALVILVFVGLGYLFGRLVL